MCLAFPGKVTSINGHKATVTYPQSEAYALIGDDQIKVGDYVMVQMGIITQTVSEQEALSSQQAWQETLAKTNQNS